MEQTISFEFATFLLGTFIASLVTGIAGFAFGLIAAAIWLYALTPVQLFVWGLPALVVGTWAGWQLYCKLDEAKFRTVVLALLIISGIGLIVRI